jgi:predicted RNA-binding protein associated with RNAse of E/G family
LSVPGVDIHYRRLPDRLTVFRQAVLEDTATHVVTFLERAGLPEPVTVGGRVVLDPDAPVVWLTFPGRWYDVGRFHRTDGRFTGYYANLLTPVTIDGRRWETTDLCLDVWLGADGRVALLDEDEYRRAVDAGWMDAATAGRARREADALVRQASRGRWPPAVARAWTLERARARLRELSTPPPGTTEP